MNYRWGTRELALQAQARLGAGDRDEAIECLLEERRGRGRLESKLESPGSNLTVASDEEGSDYVESQGLPAQEGFDDNEQEPLGCRYPFPGVEASVPSKLVHYLLGEEVLDPVQGSRCPGLGAHLPRHRAMSRAVYLSGGSTTASRASTLVRHRAASYAALKPFRTDTLLDAVSQVLVTSADPRRVGAKDHGDGRTGTQVTAVQGNLSNISTALIIRFRPTDCLLSGRES